MRIPLQRLFDSCLRGWLALAVCVCLLAFSGQAMAARTINSLTLNGASSVEVAPGESIDIEAKVKTTSGSYWQSTGLIIGAAGWKCVNSPGVTSNTTTTDNFTITAPMASGTYDLNFYAFSASNCNSTYAYTGQTYNAVITVTSPPTVTAITRASANPADSNTDVSWTVTFNRAVSGVDLTGFNLVPSSGVTGAILKSVVSNNGTASSATWTVTANVGQARYNNSETVGLQVLKSGTIVDAGGRHLGSDYYDSSKDYTLLSGCVPPPNAPAGVSCVCDNFTTSLKGSPIFGGDWRVSTSGTTPFAVAIVNGRLRLTSNSTNIATAATVPAMFPAAGNYISVEFLHYAYNGNSNTHAGDGIAVTLSDFSMTPQPGAYGGSLGYAQKTSIAGFVGGWVGIGIDEYGNYQNPSEGRIGKVNGSETQQSVAIRGSWSQWVRDTGGADVASSKPYPWLAGTGTLTQKVDNSSSTTAAPGYMYQVIVDARNYPVVPNRTDPIANPTATVTVNRDTTGTGASYAQLLNLANIYTAATSQNQGYTQGHVPDNWWVSFTGSTGDATNVHEISRLRICALKAYRTDIGTATGFNAIDEAFGASPTALDFYANGRIYTKLAGVPFKLNVGVINNINGLDTTYAKTVTLKLVDNSDGVCILNGSDANYCNATCRNRSPVTGGSQTLAFTSGTGKDNGKKMSGDFTLTSAYKNLVAVMTDGTLSACSTDAFAVRPTGMTAATTANNTGATVTPKFKAGTDAFTIKATANADGYTGTPKINNDTISALAPATEPGKISNVFPAAINSVSTGSDFKYSEVGSFMLPGYVPNPQESGDMKLRGIYDDDWTAVDKNASTAECVVGSYSNIKDARGKYGCSFGTGSDTTFGRFIPDHFTLVGGSTVTPACGTAPNAFTYMSQPFAQLKFSVEARNGGDVVTKNYAGALATGAVTPVAENNDAGDPSANLGARLSIPATAWTAGAFAVDTTAATFARAAAAPDGAYDGLQLGVKVVDATDSVPLAGANMRATTSGACTTGANAATDCDSISIGAPTKVRFGRLRLSNAYGSERLNLPIPMRAEYFNGTTFVTNTLDSCTAVVAANIGMPVYSGGVTNANMTVANNVTAGGAFAGGIGKLTLARPNPAAARKGSVDVCVDLGADVPVAPPRCVATTPLAWPWLKGRWTGGGYDDDPISRATFGVYKSSIGRGSEFIYLREMY